MKIILAAMVLSVFSSVQGLNTGKAMIKDGEEIAKLKAQNAAQNSAIAQMQSDIARIAEEHEKLADKVKTTETKQVADGKQLRELTAFTERLYEGSGQLFAYLLRRERAGLEAEQLPMKRRQVEESSALSRALALYGQADDAKTAEDSRALSIPVQRSDNTADAALHNALILFGSPMQERQPIIEEPDDK